MEGSFSRSFFHAFATSALFVASANAISRSRASPTRNLLRAGILSVRRAESIKSYLTGKGVEANRVYTEGKGKKQPVADNKTAEGRAKNRRVEIEVVGTRATGK